MKKINNMKNQNAPELSEQKINQIVKELSDPQLSTVSQYTEEELLLQILEKKLNKGLIKVKFTEGKFLLYTQNEQKGINTAIKIYDKSSQE